METKTPSLIHLAYIQPYNQLLFLRKKDAESFVWTRQSSSDDNEEEEVGVVGANIEEALQKARLHWQDKAFRTINCGFRYTLPERDEHGLNALFYQMAASYQTSNGVYFDEDLGHDCVVNFASNEARLLMQNLKKQGRL